MSFTPKTAVCWASPMAMHPPMARRCRTNSPRSASTKVQKRETENREGVPRGFFVFACLAMLRQNSGAIGMRNLVFSVVLLAALPAFAQEPAQQPAPADQQPGAAPPAGEPAPQAVTPAPTN